MGVLVSVGVGKLLGIGISVGAHVGVVVLVMRIGVASADGGIEVGNILGSKTFGNTVIGGISK